MESSSEGPQDLTAAMEKSKKRLIAEIDAEMNKPVSSNEKGKSELSGEEERRLSIESQKHFVLKKVTEEKKGSEGEIFEVSVFHLIPVEDADPNGGKGNENMNIDGEVEKKIDSRNEGEMDDFNENELEVSAQVFLTVLKNIDLLQSDLEALFLLRQVNHLAKFAVTPLLALIGVEISKAELHEVRDEVEQFLPRRLSKYQTEKVQRFSHRLKHFENELEISKSRMHQYLEIQSDIDTANKSRKDPIRSVYGLYDQEYAAVSEIYQAVMEEKMNLSSFFHDLIEGIPTERHGSLSREGYERFTEPPSPHFPMRQDTTALAELNRFRSYQANRGLPQHTLLSQEVPQTSPEENRAIARSPPTATRAPKSEAQWSDEGSPLHPHLTLGRGKTHPLGGSLDDVTHRQVGYDSPFDMDDYLDDA